MLEERGRVCLLVFSNKFSTLSPGPAFVELVKVTEKITFPVPGNERDEGAVRTGSGVGWGEGGVLLLQVRPWCRSLEML